HWSEVRPPASAVDTAPPQVGLTLKVGTWSAAAMVNDEATSRAERRRNMARLLVQGNPYQRTATRRVAGRILRAREARRTRRCIHATGPEIVSDRKQPAKNSGNKWRV